VNKIIIGIAAIIVIAAIAASIPDIPPDTETEQISCDPSYPGFCIPTFPPDLECEDISYSHFRVKGDDPHGFDPDNNGVGCEISTTPSSDLPEIAGDVESFDIVEFSLVYTKEGGIAGISESVSIDSASGLMIKKTSQGVEEVRKETKITSDFATLRSEIIKRTKGQQVRE